MPNLHANQNAQAPAQVGYVKNCEICDHLGRHGPRSVPDSNDPRFKRIVPGTEIPLDRCQVPVRVPIPNNPGHVMMMPCGCDGVTGLDAARQAKLTAAAIQAQKNSHAGLYVPEPPRARPACVLPGCDLPRTPDSSFCSEDHLNAMVEMMSAVSKPTEETPGKHAKVEE